MGLQSLFFEPHWPIVVGLVLIALPLGWLARKRTIRLAWAAAPLALAGGLAAADLLVETGRERISRLVRQAVAATAAGDAASAVEDLGDEFEVRVAGRRQIRGRDGARMVLSAVLAAYRPDSLKITRLEIDEPAPTGQATARLTLLAKSESNKVGRVVETNWRLTFSRSSEKAWRMDCADLIELNRNSAAGLPISPNLDGWFGLN